jgi:hypothetical protein
MFQRMSQKLKGCHAPNQVDRKGLKTKTTEKELRPFLPLLLLLPRLLGGGSRKTERGLAA